MSFFKYSNSFNQFSPNFKGLTRFYPLVRIENRGINMAADMASILGEKRGNVMFLIILTKIKKIKILLY